MLSSDLCSLISQTDIAIRNADQTERFVERGRYMGACREANGGLPVLVGLQIEVKRYVQEEDATRSEYTFAKSDVEDAISA